MQSVEESVSEGDLSQQTHVSVPTVISLRVISWQSQQSVPFLIEPIQNNTVANLSKYLIKHYSDSQNLKKSNSIEMDYL